MSKVERPHLNATSRASKFLISWSLALASGLIFLSFPAVSFAKPDILKKPIVTQIDEGLANGTFAPGLHGGIPKATLRDQKSAEDCWAFMAASWLESRSILLEEQNGEAPSQLEISPEHFLFWHVYDSVKTHLNDFHRLANEMNDSPEKAKQIESAFGLISETIKGRAYYQPDVGNNQETFMPEIKKYGAVPKEAYPISLTSEKKEDFLEKRMKVFVGNLLHHPELIKGYEGKADDGINDRLYSDLATSFKKSFHVNPIRPQQNFSYRGKDYSPNTFMTERLRFDPDQYATYMVGQHSKEAQAGSLDAIAQSLMNTRTGVPIGFTILANKGTPLTDIFEHNGIFTAEFCAIHPCADSAGGHAVLIVNFIYEGDSKIGYRPGDKIVALIIQNSWGQSGGRNVNGKMTKNKDKSGYFVITADYLNLLVNNPKFGGWEFTLPIAQALQLQDANKLHLEAKRGAGSKICKDFFRR